MAHSNSFLFKILGTKQCASICHTTVCKESGTWLSENWVFGRCKRKSDLSCFHKEQIRISGYPGEAYCRVFTHIHCDYLSKVMYRWGNEESVFYCLTHAPQWFKRSAETRTYFSLLKKATVVWSVTSYKRVNKDNMLITDFIDSISFDVWSRPSHVSGLAAQHQHLYLQWTREHRSLTPPPPPEEWKIAIRSLKLRFIIRHFEGWFPICWFLWVIMIPDWIVGRILANGGDVIVWIPSAKLWGIIPMNQSIMSIQYMSKTVDEAHSNNVQ